MRRINNDIAGRQQVRAAALGVVSIAKTGRPPTTVGTADVREWRATSGAWLVLVESVLSPDKESNNNSIGSWYRTRSLTRRSRRSLNETNCTNICAIPRRSPIFQKEYIYSKTLDVIHSGLQNHVKQVSQAV